MNTVVVNYGLMLKLIRKKLKMSQADLSSRLGIDRTTLSRYESGSSEFKLTPPQMIQILELLCLCGYSMNEALEYCKENSK